MMTAMEVLSDAVKIGLGSVISGVVTFAVLKSNHKKERAQRRGELLEDVSKHFAKVDRAGLKYWQANFLSETTPEAFKKLDDVMERVSTDTTSVQAILWLIGENECCDSFKACVDVMWKYPDQALNTQEEFEEAREPLRKKRKAFTDELCNIYRNLH